MAKTNYTTELNKLLLKCMTESDPMLAMLKWFCDELMEAEVSSQLGAQKSEHKVDRTSCRSGYRPRRLDTRRGTMYLMVPKVRKGDYIPFFITERRRMGKLAASLGIESLSAAQVSEMTKGLNEQVEDFRNRD